MRMGEEDIEIEKRDIEMGIIDMTDRVLGEVIKTPFVKGIIRTVLNEIDPKSASNLMKTLVWKDPEMILDVFGAVPALVNTVVGIVKEVGPAFEHFTPKILGGVVTGIVNDIDVEGLGEGVNGLVQFASSFIGYNTKLVSDLISNLLSDLFSAVDDRALGRMMGNLLGAVAPAILNPKLINVLLKDIPDLLGGLFEGLKIGDLLSSVIGTIFPTVKRLLGLLLDILGPLIKAVLKMLTPLFRIIGPLLGAVGPVLKSLVQGIGPLLGALAKGVVSLFGSSA
jgi:hypothetical protein